MGDPIMWTGTVPSWENPKQRAIKHQKLADCHHLNNGVGAPLSFLNLSSESFPEQFREEVKFVKGMLERPIPKDESSQNTNVVTRKRDVSEILELYNEIIDSCNNYQQSHWFKNKNVELLKKVALSDRENIMNSLSIVINAGDKLAEIDLKWGDLLNNKFINEARGKDENRNPIKKTSQDYLRDYESSKNDAEGLVYYNSDATDGIQLPRLTKMIGHGKFKEASLNDIKHHFGNISKYKNQQKINECFHSIFKISLNWLVKKAYDSLIEVADDIGKTTPFTNWLPLLPGEQINSLQDVDVIAQTTNDLMKSIKNKNKNNEKTAATAQYMQEVLGLYKTEDEYINKTGMYKAMLTYSAKEAKNTCKEAIEERMVSVATAAKDLPQNDIVLEEKNFAKGKVVGNEILEGKSPAKGESPANFLTLEAGEVVFELTGGMKEFAKIAGKVDDQGEVTEDFAHAHIGEFLEQKLGKGKGYIVPVGKNEFALKRNFLFSLKFGEFKNMPTREIVRNIKNIVDGIDTNTEDYEDYEDYEDRGVRRNTDLSYKKIQEFTNYINSIKWFLRTGYNHIIEQINKVGCLAPFFYNLASLPGDIKDSIESLNSFSQDYRDIIKAIGTDKLGEDVKRWLAAINYAESLIGLYNAEKETENPPEAILQAIELLKKDFKDLKQQGIVLPCVTFDKSEITIFNIDEATEALEYSVTDGEAVDLSQFHIPNIDVPISEAIARESDYPYEMTQMNRFIMDPLCEVFKSKGLSLIIRMVKGFYNLAKKIKGDIPSNCAEINLEKYGITEKEKEDFLREFAFYKTTTIGVVNDVFEELKKYLDTKSDDKGKKQLLLDLITKKEMQGLLQKVSVAQELSIILMQANFRKNDEKTLKIIEFFAQEMNSVIIVKRQYEKGVIDTILVNNISDGKIFKKIKEIQGMDTYKKDETIALANNGATQPQAATTEMSTLDFGTIGAKGIYNSGNYCFAISTFQVLFRVPGLAEFLEGLDISKTSVKGKPEESEKNKKILEGLQKLLAKYKEKHTLDEMKKIMDNIIEAAFGKGVAYSEGKLKQQDANELFTEIANALSTYGFTKFNIGGTQTITALGKSDPDSETENSSMVVSCAIGAKTNLTDILKDNFAIEEIDYNGKKANKKHIISSLPTQFVIQLNRFEYDPNEGIASKVSTKVDIPETLDLTPYIMEGYGLEDYCKYTLTAAQVHHGNAYSNGHYTALIRDKNGVWAEFNDGSVTKIGSYELVKEQLKDAYILYYTQNGDSLQTSEQIGLPPDSYKGATSTSAVATTTTPPLIPATAAVISPVSAESSVSTDKGIGSKEKKQSKNVSRNKFE